MGNEGKGKCIKCGKDFKDSYNDLNELNKRVWCNSCVSEEWNLRKLNKVKPYAIIVKRLLKGGLK